MKEEKTTPLRERMIEDMRIRGMSPKTQQAHIRAVRYLAEFIGRSPDTTTPDELRAYQLHMTDSGVSTGVFNARIVSLRFFFGMTCGREEMKRYMQFRRKAKKLPVVLSVEEVGDLLAAVPGPGLKYRAALGIKGAGRMKRSLLAQHNISWSPLDDRTKQPAPVIQSSGADCIARSNGDQPATNAAKNDSSKSTEHCPSCSRGKVSFARRRSFPIT